MPEPVFHNKKTQDMVRKYIKLRYRLMPYNYSLSYQNSLTGMPLMRPLFFEDESNLELIAEKDCYLWGDAFLVKPVTDPGATSAEMGLPEGVWFNFWNDKRYQGNQTVSVKAPLDTLPVMVRAGSFVPTVADFQSTAEYSTKRLRLHYYADDSVKQASGVMYDDDGNNPNAIQDKQFETLNFGASQQAGSLKLDLTRHGEYQGMPKSRDMQLIVHHWQKKPGSVVVGDEQIKLVRDRASLNKADTAAYWNKKFKQLEVKFAWQQDLSIQVNKD